LLERLEILFESISAIFVVTYIIAFYAVVLVNGLFMYPIGLWTIAMFLVITIESLIIASIVTGILVGIFALLLFITTTR